MIPLELALAVSDGVNWFNPQGIALIIVAVFGSGGLGVYFKNRVPKEDREDRMLNRYEKRIENLEGRADASAGREQMRDDYIMELRQHISEGMPPPPPPYPRTLSGQKDDDPK